ncbi:MAG TPA: hypothetical protein PLY40_05535 [Bacillota bacterium]|nr:hypothetical protein [Bacillota bacterium]
MIKCAKVPTALWAALLLMTALAVAAAYILNWARLYFDSNEYIDRAIISAEMPEHISRLGLQLAYSEAGESENRLFLEKLAAGLEQAGVGRVVILPDLIYLDAASETLEGIFLITLHRELSGWQLKRRGVSVVNCHFVPLRKMAISYLRAGSTVTGSAAGWLSRSYFSSQMLKFAAEQSARALAGGLDLAAPVEGASAAPVFVEDNLAAIPMALAVMLPPDARVLSAAFQDEYFLLTFSTSMEAADLEPLLTGNLVHEMNLKVTADWVNFAGARRKAAFVSADQSFQVEVFYACSSDYWEIGDSKGPRRSTAGELKIVHIIKRPGP